MRPNDLLKVDALTRFQHRSLGPTVDALCSAQDYSYGCCEYSALALIDLISPPSLLLSSSYLSSSLLSFFDFFLFFVLFSFVLVWFGFSR